MVAPGCSLAVGLLALVVCAVNASAAAGALFPGEHWERRTPKQVGMSSEGLRAFGDYVGGRGCVVRHGYMVYTWGDAAQRGDVASAAKAWYSHFLLRAFETGMVPDLDQRAVEWEPRLAGINAALGHKDRAITWRHLANQTSCYGVTEAPGTAYDYNDWQMALFWDALFLRVYGATYDNVDAQVLHPLLTDVLQCQDEPTLMAFGTGDRPGRVGVSPRDFARFGLLYLNEGNWRGRQVLRPDLAVMAVTSPLPNSIPRTAGREAEMVPGQRSIGSRNVPDNQTDHMGSYSYLWWTNGADRAGRRHWPDAPPDAYAALGHGGRRAMVVLPALDTVVSWNDTKIRGAEMENKALRLLMASVVEAGAPAPMPGQVALDPGNPRWFRLGRTRPFFMCGPGDPEGFLYRGTRNPDGTRDGDQMDLVHRMAGTGANCIYLTAVRSHGGDGDRTENPFVDSDPQKGLSDPILDQWDGWFTEMDRLGIVIYFIIYDDGSSIWQTGSEMGEPERAFVTALVRRFDHHRNLIWCIAEEYQEALRPERVSAIAAAIRAADAYDHPIAVHKLAGIEFGEFADDPNVDQFAIQLHAGTPDELHAQVLQAWRDADGRYNLNLAEVAEHGSGRQARLVNWAAAMAGAYVMVIGMDIAHTDPADLEDCGRLVRFFEATDFTRMEPHDELAAAGTRYVLARPGESYIAYAPDLRGPMGLKDLPAGTYSLRWLDIVTGRTVEQDAVPAGDGWTPPDASGAEVAVYVRRMPH